MCVCGGGASESSRAGVIMMAGNEASITESDVMREYLFSSVCFRSDLDFPKPVITFTGIS